MRGRRRADESNADVLVYELAESSELGLTEGIHGTNRRRSSFFQIDLEIIRSMRGQSVSFGFTEDIGEVMILFGNVGEVDSLVRDRGSSRRDCRVGEVNSKTLCSRKFASPSESGCTYHGNTRDGGFRGYRRYGRLLRREPSCPGRRRRGRNQRVKKLRTENDTAQYPVNQWIVAGEPVIS